MGKILFVLDIPEPEPRKKAARPVQKHKNKKLYSRKVKHKDKAGVAPGQPGAFFWPRPSFIFAVIRSGIIRQHYKRFKTPN